MPITDILDVPKKPESAPVKPWGTNRKDKPAKPSAKGDAYYCLHAGDNPDGGSVLSAPMTEKDALVESFKKDIYFYRVQKLKAQVASSSGSVKLVAAPTK